jgi:hypothetical protein
VSDAKNLRTTGERIEQLLSELEGMPDRRALEHAEELIRLLTDMYGAGLERILDASCGAEPMCGPELLEFLGRDQLVSSLLLLHDLHPESPEARIERALEDLSATLGAGDAHLLEFNETEGSAKIRLLSTGGGSAQVATDELVRRAVEKVAPEVERIELVRPLPSSPVRLGPSRRAAPVNDGERVAGVQ